MRRAATAAAALATVWAAGVAAETAPEPPLWANLAECSAVFAAAARSDDAYSGAEAATLAQAEQAAAAFRAAAVREAATAGQANPEGDVASIMEYLNPRWENRIDRIFSVRSNLRWIAYCGEIGRASGALPLPE